MMQLYLKSLISKMYSFNEEQPILTALHWYILNGSFVIFSHVFASKGEWNMQIYFLFMFTSS